MEAIERTFLLKVPSSTENLALIREFVGSIAQQSGMNAMDAGKLELAIDEACANVIEHAYGHDISKEVVIRARFDEETLRIDVEDTGNGFDPNAIKQEELEQLVNKRRTGGLGMRLMKTLMDEVHYEIEPGKKNELHMVKHLRKNKV
ncbi:MAG TPA: ATP-binding protein [Pyrinomonadaceae bacterium]|jgi:serine/threonine-protein kinase RsbW